MPPSLRINCCEWDRILQPEYEKEYFTTLEKQVLGAYESETEVYPPSEDLFRAYRLTPPQSVRCVVLGQDPYHEPGQAHGLSFSVKSGTKLPPSLRNIFKEIESDTGETCDFSNGDLSYLAEQGVLLLNTVLTVEKGKANSHKNFGWQHFTAATLSALNQLEQPTAFILWGSHAQALKKTICDPAGPRLVVESVHPSPLSAYRGFFGSRPFSQVNIFLEQNGQKAIHWCNQ